MPTFTCPRGCGKTLEIVDSIAVTPKNSLSQDELIQTIHCPSCNLMGIGLYCESSAGADESVHHDGYILEQTSYDMLIGLIAQAHTDETKRKELNEIYQAGFDGNNIDIDWKNAFPII